MLVLNKNKQAVIPIILLAVFLIVMASGCGVEKELTVEFAMEELKEDSELVKQAISEMESAVNSDKSNRDKNKAIINTRRSVPLQSSLMGLESSDVEGSCSCGWVHRITLRDGNKYKAPGGSSFEGIAGAAGYYSKALAALDKIQWIDDEEWDYHVYYVSKGKQPPENELQKEYGLGLDVTVIGKWDTERNGLFFHYNERQYSVTEMENVLIEKAKEMFNEGDKVIEETG